MNIDHLAIARHFDWVVAWENLRAAVRGGRLLNITFHLRECQSTAIKNTWADKRIQVCKIFYEAHECKRRAAEHD